MTVRAVRSARIEAKGNGLEDALGNTGGDEPFADVFTRHPDSVGARPDGADHIGRWRAELIRHDHHGRPIADLAEVIGPAQGDTGEVVERGRAPAAPMVNDDAQILESAS